MAKINEIYVNQKVRKEGNASLYFIGHFRDYKLNEGRVSPTIDVDFNSALKGTYEVLVKSGISPEAISLVNGVSGFEETAREKINDTDFEKAKESLSKIKEGKYRNLENLLIGRLNLITIL